MNGIVVGVDESVGAAHALRWAAREGRLRGVPVTAVMVWGYLDQHHVAVDAPFDPHYDEPRALAVLDAIVDAVLEPDAAILVGRHVVCALAAPGLLEAAEGANLLVLGARGLGGFRELLVGSVSQHCLHHAEGPVAIVHGAVPAFPSQSERIVVGVDGSATARRALAWALDEARLRHATIEAVTAWSAPPVVSPYGIYGAPTAALEDAAHEILRNAVADADLTGLPAPLSQRVACGSPSHVILEAARDADLIVLGSRGLGGFKGLLLGSVTHQVTHHAGCPVVVIPTVDAERPWR